MSQIAVYELLLELGGRASAIEIRQLALKRYPESTLHTYVSQRLHKLEEEGVIRHNRDATWEVIPGKTFPIVQTLHGQER